MWAGTTDIAIGHPERTLTNKQAEAARGGREPWPASAPAPTLQPAGPGSTPQHTGTGGRTGDWRGGSFSYFWRALLANRTEGRRLERVGGSKGGTQSHNTQCFSYFYLCRCKIPLLAQSLYKFLVFLFILFSPVPCRLWFLSGKYI